MPIPRAPLIIEPGSDAEFSQYYDLRWKILRAPWKQPPGSERDKQDESGTHLMLINTQGTTVGVGRLHFNSISEAQIRYMAIDTPWQRCGCGTQLLHALEQRAGDLGARRITLDARETALRFYRKHGYETCGPGHVLFNSVAHIRMEKQIDQQAVS